MNNRKATKSRIIQRVPNYDKPKESKNRKVIGYRFVRHFSYKNMPSENYID